MNYSIIFKVSLRQNSDIRIYVQNLAVQCHTQDTGLTHEELVQNTFGKQLLSPLNAHTTLDKENGVHKLSIHSSLRNCLIAQIDNTGQQVQYKEVLCLYVTIKHLVHIPESRFRKNDTVEQEIINQRILHDQSVCQAPGRVGIQKIPLDFHHLLNSRCGQLAWNLVDSNCIKGTRDAMTIFVVTLGPCLPYFKILIFCYSSSTLNMLAESMQSLYYARCVQKRRLSGGGERLSRTCWRIYLYLFSYPSLGMERLWHMYLCLLKSEGYSF